MARVHVFGSLNVDLVVYVDQLPKPGETRHGTHFLTTPGGKGLNQAIAAARAGAAVSMIGAVGADDYGRSLIEIVKHEGIDGSSIIGCEELATGVALISVDDCGENYIVIVAGANYAADPRLLRARPGDIVMAQLETPMASVVTLFEIAKESGATTILNPAPATKLTAELLALTDYLIPNEHEAAQLTKIETGQDVGAIAAARELLRSGVKTCVVTLGARGAVLVDGDGSTAQPAFRVTPIDTTAAGDAFCGAFAASLAHGEAKVQALTFAAAAGALATTIAGASTSLPQRERILALIKNGDVR